MNAADATGAQPATPRHALQVRQDSACYPVTIGSMVRAELPGLLRELGASSVAMVVDRKCERWLKELRNYLPQEIPTWLFDATEADKTLRSVESISQWLLSLRPGMDRNALLIAMGGGITTDIVGCVAALWKRGLRWLALPTTTLAIADASVGGKVGVNLGDAKNQLGAFWPPCAVMADTLWLSSLPAREFRAGLAEVVKMAAIWDAALLADMEAFAPGERSAHSADPRLASLLARAVAIKGRVVEADEREQSVRVSLNFGHTLGHGLEMCAQPALLHGEAVANGMLAATRLAQTVGACEAGFADRLSALLAGLGLPTGLSGYRWDVHGVVDCLLADKKVSGRALRWVLPTGRPGEQGYVIHETRADVASLTELLRELLHY